MNGKGKKGSEEKIKGIGGKVDGREPKKILKENIKRMKKKEMEKNRRKITKEKI